jgi:hypothetical protein
VASALPAGMCHTRAPTRRPHLRSWRLDARHTDSRVPNGCRWSRPFPESPFKANRRRNSSVDSRSARGSPYGLPKSARVAQDGGLCHGFKSSALYSTRQRPRRSLAHACKKSPARWGGQRRRPLHVPSDGQLGHGVAEKASSLGCGGGLRWGPRVRCAGAACIRAGDYRRAVQALLAHGGGARSPAAPDPAPPTQAAIG